ncbi:MAG: hypothetical protein U9O20_04760 [Patescibacteria group bacterium]|nr:hypothetical protein [Patescibacteria group bacterium]
MRELEFDKPFDEHHEDFFNFIDSESPKTNYDIEIAITKSVFVLFDKVYFSKIKEYLYNDPRKKKTECYSGSWSLCEG